MFYKDVEGRYLGFNNAFEKFFGKTREQLVGKTVYDINPSDLAQKYHKMDIELISDGGLQQYESQVKTANGELRDVIFSKAAFLDNKETVRGLIGTILDITERKKSEQDRERMITELKKALAEIKTLSGLLPICSHCKKIRDDKGYWNQIEGYIQKHSDAEFSHGMCPECSDELYGKEDWYIEMKNEENQNK